jgi:iron complex transport system substrate-binding protein
MKSSRLFLVIGLLLSSPASAAPPPSQPQRIVSLNACADAYVVALADPGRIAALTEYARDPELSTVAAQAKHLPVSKGGAEEVLALRPDLIIASPERRATTTALLRGRSARIVDLPEQDGIAGIERAIAVIADAVGHPERGRALIADIRTRLARIGPSTGRGRVAAYYQRRGYLTGTGTLIDEMMARVGLVNLAARLHKPILSHLSLEEMAAARPDFLILESGSRDVVDRGTEMLAHPLLARVVPPAHRLYIPQALTVCGSPAYPQAVALLAAELRRADGVGVRVR